MKRTSPGALTLPRLVLLTAACCAGAGFAASAAEPSAQPRPRSETNATPPKADAGQPGRRAVRDPETGALVDGPLPDAASAQARGARAAAPAAAPSGAVRPEEMNELMLQFMQRTKSESRAVNGARTTTLTPRHLSSSVAVRKPDGSIATQCVSGETEAEHRLHAPRVDVQGLKERHHAQ